MVPSAGIMRAEVPILMLLVGSVVYQSSDATLSKSDKKSKNSTKKGTNQVSNRDQSFYMYDSLRTWCPISSFAVMYGHILHSRKVINRWTMSSIEI